MRVLVYGIGVTGEAVARALVAHGHSTLLADDEPGAPDVHVRPRDSELDALLGSADALVPSPGVPEHHPAIVGAVARGLPIVSELDLATDWEAERMARGGAPRQVLAITGTDGKTTVTTMVTAMLEASGGKALAVGNTEVPFVAALDEDVETFVVEASSFRLRFAERFSPRVATWLNLAPDHLDWHSSLEAYAAAKARIYEHQAADAVAVGNAGDEIVLAHLRRAPGRRVTFGADRGEYHVRDGEIMTPGDGPILPVSELTRQLPHDVANALAATATALEGGATRDGVREVLRTFRGLPHRVAFVAEADGIRWFDDSKATAPHATTAAISGFERVVLIAGGRNKGLDLTALADQAARVRAVVAIGESAADVAAAFSGRAPVTEAGSMSEAVSAARRLAHPGDAVLLSPGCASFDWYRNYAERGDDFVRAVHELVGS
jgi:UDP-N-acetylmuramoylalanine--D-glutamate ligase